MIKTWLYAVASVLLGAWVSPLIYNAGKALAEVSSVKEMNGPLEMLANVCRRGEFPAFFLASWAMAAVVLFFPWMSWLRDGRGKASLHQSLCPQENVQTEEKGYGLKPNPQGLRQLVLGMVLMACFHVLIGGVLVGSGVFQIKYPAQGRLTILGTMLLLAMGLSVMQEMLFRGLALGIFLRAMRPAVALGLSAVLFAGVYFLHPPVGMNVLDPDGSGTGFELLGKITARFLQPGAVWASFVPALAFGWVLAYARWRTASLYLPIGLHAGWIFANGCFASVTLAAHASRSAMWLVPGEFLHQGFVSLLEILFALYLTQRLTCDATKAS